MKTVKYIKWIRYPELELPCSRQTHGIHKCAVHTVHTFKKKIQSKYILYFKKKSAKMAAGFYYIFACDLRIYKKNTKTHVSFL
jgi:hypothetical protein